MGKTVPVRIYSLMGDALHRETADFQRLQRDHDAVLAAYREQRWSDALQLIVAQLNSETVPHQLLEFYGLFRDRVMVYQAAPPPADWDGAFVMTGK